MKPRVDPGPASKLEIFAWCMFDFANSSFTTMIVTFAYPLYFVKTVTAAKGYTPGEADGLWGLGSGVSQALVLLSAPVVGAIADFSGGKKRFLLVTYLGCVAGTAALAFVGPGDVALGLGIFIAANVCFSSGENIIAAFLPEIAAPEKMGRVSGLGWALGYFGGIGSLFVSLPFLKDGVGAENAASVQVSFVIVAIYFLVAGLPTFLFLRERAVPRPRPAGQGYARLGFGRVLKTLKEVRRYRQLFRFLFVFLAYTCGVNAVVYFSNIYAEREIGMGLPELIVLFAILNLSGALGAYAFGTLQDRVSSKMAIILSLVLWLAACVQAYFSTSRIPFYVAGLLAGLALGSSQSAGRALVGTFAPASRSGEFFGFWGLFWKLSAVIGLPLFGTISEHYDIRTAILSTMAFFVIGIFGMLFIDEEEGRRTAREAGP
ncbi:MAG TPA: MFS transporter [Planctomycetota bacterium]|nr:MFS transporter [Planctomycetota bacterium]